MGMTKGMRSAEAVSPPTVHRAKVDHMSAFSVWRINTMGRAPNTVVAVVMKMGRIRS